MTPRTSLLILFALTAACSRQPERDPLDRLDAELTDANASGANDPALRSALAGQIMVDPALLQGDDSPVRPVDRIAAAEVPQDIARPDPVDPRSLRPAPPPRTAPSPLATARDGALTLGALAGRQPDRGTARCAGDVRYSAIWATRLPAALPLYPDARVGEAAGNDADGCALRVVSFVSSAAPGKVVDWYYTHARRAGYSAEHLLDGNQHILGGTQGEHAYVVYASPRAGGGSTVDLVANAGS